MCDPDAPSHPPPRRASNHQRGTRAAGSATNGTYCTSVNVRAEPISPVGRGLTIDETLRRIKSVTLDDAQRVAHRVLSRPMTLTVLGPFGPTAFRGALA